MCRIPDGDSGNRRTDQITLASRPPGSSSKHATCFSGLLSCTSPRAPRWRTEGKQETALAFEVPLSAGDSLVTIDCSKAEQRPLPPAEVGLQVKSRASGAHRPRFKSCQAHCLVMWPRTSYLSSLKVGGLIYKMRMVIGPTSWGHERSKVVFFKCLAHPRHFVVKLNIIFRESILLWTETETTEHRGIEHISTAF